jgi:hypothetical protein
MPQLFLSKGVFRDFLSNVFGGQHLRPLWKGFRKVRVIFGKDFQKGLRRSSAGLAEGKAPLGAKSINFSLYYFVARSKALRH